jgi:polysaccharide biosynthesis/export protein VpsN
MEWKANLRLAPVCLWLLFLPGCVSTPGGGELAAYRPDVDPMAVEIPAIEQASAQKTTPAQNIRYGDRMHVSLRGIPSPEEMQCEVDEGGNITLPLVGPVVVAGLTSSAAERVIEKAFVDGGYYRKITVMLVPEADQYFVQGEVRNQGRFNLAGDMTLLQAIAAAGGYTDYAKPSEVKVIRGEEVLYFDAGRIARRKDPDPLIKRGDIVVVERRVFL